MELADYLYGVDVVGPLRHHYRAVDVAYLGLVGYHVAEAPAVLDEALHQDPGGSSYDVQLADVLRVQGDVQRPFERSEAEEGFELLHVAALADVVAPLAHPGGDAPVDGDVVGQLEYAAVLVILLLELLYPFGGDLYALPPRPQVPHDVLLIQKLQNSFRGRLLAHLQDASKLAGRDCYVIVYSS